MIKKILKLLKKFDIIDVISAIIFFFIIAMLAFFFLRKSEYVSVVIRVGSTDNFQNTWTSKPPQWYLEKTKVGLKEKDVLGRTNVEITDVHYYPTNYQEQTIFIKMKMRAVYSANKDQYTYNGIPLLVGSYQNFNLGNIKIPGMILSVGDENNEIKIYKIKGEIENKYNEEIKGLANITYQGIQTYIYNNIPKNIELYDNKNMLILKTTSIDFKPAYKEFVNGRQVFKLFDPERKRVFIEALVLTKKVNDAYLFREEDQLKLKETIPMYMDKMSLTLTILNVENATESEESYFNYSQ